jgi:hypothetical protein
VKPDPECTASTGSVKENYNGILNNNGVLEYWIGGVLEWWSTGVVEYWSGGALECWIKL